MSKITKPLLSGTLKDPEDLTFPVGATPKLDGIRALMIDGKLVSRNFKPIPNDHARNILESILPDGIDGELMLRNTDNFNDVQSGIMRKDGEPDFYFAAFDYVKSDLEEPYSERMKNLSKILAGDKAKYQGKVIIEIIEPKIVSDVAELAQFENECIADGYEGVMVRSLTGKYKCGRSTVREGILLKIKRFIDAEAVITGFEEQLSNTNEATKDAFGRTKRSSEKAGMVANGKLGNIHVKDIKTGIEFEIGSGFDDALRTEIWNNQKKYLNKIVKYKYQEMGRTKPRFPVFLGFRHKNDM